MYNMTVTYGKGFRPVVPMKPLTERVSALQAEISKMPQYEAPTEHIFHGGMYCRQVWRPAGCVIVGKVHRKEHFYMIVSGTVTITTDEGVQTITGPFLLCSKPGTKRAVYAETDALCMTFHRTDAATVEDAELELVENDPNATIGVGNKIKMTEIEVQS
jgi:quercetin dioxygenase-like cupin family protein